MAVFLLPTLARANDLGALAWVVLVWPAGLLCGLLLLVLGALSVLRLRRGRPSSRLATVVTVATLVLDAAFGSLALLSTPATAVGPSRFALAHVALFQLLAVPVLGLGLLLRTRSRRGQTRQGPAAGGTP